MMTRRGISLIEMLVTISILSLLMIVSVSWMTTMLRSQDVAGNNANWKRASSALLDRIAEDIHAVDRLEARSRQSGARIIVEGSVLRIETRDQQGLSVNRYIFNQELGAVHRIDQSASEALYPIPLLGDVGSFECMMNLPSESRLVPTMIVSLQSMNGISARRTFVLDLEDVQ